LRFEERENVWYNKLASPMIRNDPHTPEKGEKMTDHPMIKNYENIEWLRNELKTKTPRMISKEVGVSYKLINKWAVSFGLIRNTPEIKLP
jgi:hypothetical protein